MFSEGEKVENMQALRQYMRSRFVERAEVVDIMMVALGAREHVLFLGPPGTAKSEMVRTLAARIGLRYFERLLTAFTGPDELFGPVDLRALEQGSYRRVTAGKLPEAEVAFIDEVFKANSAILNTLLTVMNERLYHNDGQVQQVPLQVLFGASNELPAGEEQEVLRAFADRFLLRCQVQYTSDAGFRQMLDLAVQDAGQPPHVSREELVQYQAASAACKIGSAVLDALAQIRQEARAQGVVLSDRRWVKSLQVLRAAAALRGAQEVDPEEDGWVLCHLWPEPEMAAPLAAAVQKVLDSAGLAIKQRLQEAQEIADAALKAASPEAGMEGVKKLKAIRDELEKLAAGASGKAAQRAREAVAQVTALNTKVAQVCLGIGVAV